MAGLRTCRNSAPVGKNELIGRVFTEGSNIFTPTPAIFCALTPAFAPTLGPPGMYTDMNLQKAIRLALKLFVKGQKHGQANFAPQDRFFKARNPDLYYRSLYMECYYFCQQFEDHFDIASVTSHQRVSFAVLFL